MNLSKEEGRRKKEEDNKRGNSGSVVGKQKRKRALSFLA